ncbi:MAG: CAP domain-containing protein [Actinobacteria bacterium]|nr:CAP domain-containing protein [Actinomycetota bacterium]
MPSKRVLLAAVVVLACFGLGLSLPMDAARAEPQTEEAQFIVLTNQLRVSKGLVPLAPDGHLTDVARAWSAQMASSGTLAHNPNFAVQMGSGWRKLGENVGVGASVDWLQQAFINSPHHYENLVDPDFRMVGVGVVDTADGNIWVTVDFEQSKSATALPSAVTPRPNPTPAPAPKPKPAPRPSSPPPSSQNGGAGGVTSRNPSTRPAAAPVAATTPTTAAPAPEVTTTTAPAPVVEAARTKRPNSSLDQRGVLAASIGPPRGRMWSGFVLGCILSVFMGLLIARMLSARNRLLRKEK